MDPKTFCIIPWAHTRFSTQGTIHPCCKLDISWPGRKNINDIDEFDQYWNSDELRQMRLDHLAGKKIDACQVCWTDEQAGKGSLRTEYNSQFAKHIDLKKIRNSTTGHSSDLPVLLDLNLSNICNYKCVMCAPALSSKIAQEQQQHKEQFQSLGFFKISNASSDHQWPEGSFFVDFMKKVAPGLRNVELKGGEPLLVKNVKKTIQEIQNKSECVIALTTNGSVDFEDDFLQLLSEFKKLWIFVSVDGVGSAGEWVRQGSDWPQVESVLKKISTLQNCTFRLSTVLQVFSPVTFPDIFYYSKQHKYNIEILQCVMHDYLGINAIPPVRAKSFHQWVLDQQKIYPNDLVLKAIDGYFKNYCFDPDLFDKCQKYVSTLNQIRNNQCPDIQTLFQ
jgi:MoaA/NifB/PqqE/SkfB family radical SAM enzyme